MGWILKRPKKGDLSPVSSFDRLRTAPERGEARGSRKGRLLLGAGAMALALSACSTGTYAVEIFPEQHYQQSHKRQEPPRLSPPDGAVPITGREAASDPAAAAQVRNPLPKDQKNLTLGAETFRVNCSMCHGEKGQGDGKVGDVLVKDGYSRPPDLMQPATQGKSDGAIFALVSNGVVVMPKFSLLLSEQDRWSVVQYLRFLAQQGQ